jgi:hypothetical protein
MSKIKQELSQNTEFINQIKMLFRRTYNKMNFLLFFYIKNISKKKQQILVCTSRLYKVHQPFIRQLEQSIVVFLLSQESHCTQNYKNHR